MLEKEFCICIVGVRLLSMDMVAAGGTNAGLSKKLQIFGDDAARICPSHDGPRLLQYQEEENRRTGEDVVPWFALVETRHTHRHLASGNFSRKGPHNQLLTFLCGPQRRRFTEADRIPGAVFEKQI